MDSQSQQLLNEYLDDVELELADVSPTLRRDFVAEIRSHFVEEWNHSMGKSPADMRNILERFGDAREIAAEFRERHNLGEKVAVSPAPPFPAVFIIVLTIFLWPVGIILAWLSPFWQTKHKLVATLLPLLMLLLIPFTFFSYSTGSVTIETSYLENHDFPEGSWESEVGGVEGPQEIYIEESRGPSPMVNTIALIVGGTLLLIGNPLGSGIYLAITKKPTA